MRLTVRDNPRGLERYRHIPPGSRLRPRCPRICPGTSYACTLERGHRGPHVSHGFLGRVKAVWDGGEGPGASDGRPGPRNARRRPVGLRHRTPDSLLSIAKNALRRLGDSGEEIALVVFFVAFVWFAIDWLRLIFQ